MLKLFLWAMRQLWYLPNDELCAILFDRLDQSRNIEGIQLLFDYKICDSSEHGKSSFCTCNWVIQCSAKAEKLEVSVCFFKKTQESSSKIVSIIGAPKCEINIACPTCGKLHMRTSFS